MMNYCSTCGTRIPRHASFCPCCSAPIHEAGSCSRANGYSCEEQRERNRIRRAIRHNLERDFRSRFTFCLVPVIFSMLIALAVCGQPGLPVLLMGLGLAPAVWIIYRIYRLVRHVLFGLYSVVLGIVAGLLTAWGILDGISKLPHALPTLVPVLAVVLWYGWYLYSLVVHLQKLQRLYSRR